MQENFPINYQKFFRPNQNCQSITDLQQTIHRERHCTGEVKLYIKTMLPYIKNQLPNINNMCQLCHMSLCHLGKEL